MRGCTTCSCRRLQKSFVSLVHLELINLFEIRNIDFLQKGKLHFSLRRDTVIRRFVGCPLQIGTVWLTLTWKIEIPAGTLYRAHNDS